MEASSSNSPLLAVGTYGVHLLSNPAGTYSFFGTVPSSLMGKNWTTYADGYQAFIDWFLGMTNEEQAQHIEHLREDVKVQLLEEQG